MIKPEEAAFQIKLRPAFKPATIPFAPRNAVIAALVILAALGLVAYVLKLGSWGESNRAAWAYPTVALMFILSTAAGAPLIAYASRAARGYWALPARRVAELYIIPATLSYILLIPIFATLPPLEGRANLWFDFHAGAPFLTDALAVATMILAGVGMLWISAVPDLAVSWRSRGDVSGWRRALIFNWTGTTRQWIAIRVGTRVFGAFYLMSYVYAHLVLSTDLGQSLLPGWRSGIFPAYHALTGIQGGLALTIVTLFLVKRYSSLGKFIGNEQAISLGKLLLATTLLWFYFFWSDFVLVWYARIPSEVAAMQLSIAMTYRLPFYIAFSGLFAIPFVFLIFNPIRRNLWALASVSVVVLIGLVCDRIRLFVPSMTHPDPTAHSLGSTLPEAFGPSALDVLFIVGWIAIIALAFLWIASRIPPLVGWELREGALLRREQRFMKAHVYVLGKPD